MGMTLKALRVNKNLKQKEAGAMIGVREETIRSWEQGKTYPDARQIRQIEKVYDTTYDQINFFNE